MWKKGLPFLSLKKNIKAHHQEIIALLYCGILLFLTMSCISFKPNEQSPFYFSTQKTPLTNWCGKWGAYSAAWCFYLFGITIFGFLLLGFYLLYHFICKTITKEVIRKSFGTTTFCIFLSAFFYTFKNSAFSFEPGGAIGYTLFSHLSERFGYGGTLLILCLGFWISLLYMLGRSPLAYLQEALLFTLQKIKNSFYTAHQTLLFGVRKIYRLYQFLRQLPHTVISLITMFIPFKRKETEAIPQITKEKEIEEKKSSTLVFDKAKPNRQYKILFHKSYTWLRNTCIPPKIELPDFTPAYQGKESDFSLPNLDELIQSSEAAYNSEALYDEQKLQAQRLEEKLLHFGIEGKVTAIQPGPIVTLFEYTPAIGTKISKIVALEDDLAMVLKARSIRIRAPIPGRSVVGFEISNEHRQNVFLSNIVHSNEYKDDDSILPLALGVDIVGKPIITDLANMPHLLVAGSTGSGKSVGLNAMLTTLLARRTPEELRVILIDPKRLEFAPYRDIPHLLVPIITEARTVAPVLKWVVEEMERRYEILSQKGVRNLLDYRELMASKNQNDEPFPFIVIVIDELADLMMVAGKEIELLLARISQMARAAGIHMIVATQRPSVDVLTGTIKVNFPSRISFRVSSKVDSKTILDSPGAEKLLGRGDILFMNPSSAELKRIHGAYVSDHEIETLTAFLRGQKKVSYLNLDRIIKEKGTLNSEEIEDDLYNEIVHYVQSVEEISISMLQRKYRIGFNRSARIIEQLELHGLIAPAQGGKPRKVIR